ncbi:hypothetical protein [Mycobacterium sp. Lab-001]|uniref:hypothetical protein n=1 Tax=Mycobacterium sp. Lab-001 TaxID=3410136 RepID=UPI003D185746
MSEFGAPDVAAAEAVAVLMTEVSEGRLAASTMADRAATRCREVFGQCDGPTDPLWSVHVELARQVLGHGGLPAAELAQRLSVARNRENPGAAADYRLGNAHSPSNNDDDLGGDDELADVPCEVLAEAEAAALAVIDRYRQPDGDGDGDL